MFKHFFLLIVVLFENALSYKKDSKISAQIEDLDNRICEGIRNPYKGGAKHFLETVKLFNTLFRKIKKTYLSTKEQELHGKKHVLADTVLKMHPHFLTLHLDDDRLKDEGKWENNEVALLKGLLAETERIKGKLQNAIENHRKYLNAGEQ